MGLALSIFGGLGELGVSCFGFCFEELLSCVLGWDELEVFKFVDEFFANKGDYDANNIDEMDNLTHNLVHQLIIMADDDP